jgi:hypothetical protein
MSGKDVSKTARLDVGIWFNETTGHIHIAAKDQFISTVSNDPSSKRYLRICIASWRKRCAMPTSPTPTPPLKGRGLN